MLEKLYVENMEYRWFELHDIICVAYICVTFKSPYDLYTRTDLNSEVRNYALLCQKAM